MKYIVTIICHGVEDRAIPDNYAQPLIDNIRSVLSETEKSYFLPASVNYSKTTQYRQMQMYKFCDSNLGKLKLRQIKYTIGGDLIIYARTKSGAGFFSELHATIDNLIRAKLEQASGAAVVLLGHSLGTIILYNHFFETKLATKPTGIFMMGSPFALYSLPYENWGSLPPAISFMQNFYNYNDWISSKIQDNHPCEEIAEFCEDFEVKPTFFSWDWWVQKTALMGGLNAHSDYWHNKTVAKTIAGKLSELIKNE